MHAATGAPHSQLTAEYALLNKQVLSPVLNESIELAARRAAGNLFQHLGPAAEKAQSPNRVFICLTRRSRFINASAVQGSGFRPSSFYVVVSDLHPLNPFNSIVKYADDTYPILLASDCSSVPAALHHLSSWGGS